MNIGIFSLINALFMFILDVYQKMWALHDYGCLLQISKVLK